MNLAPFIEHTLLKSDCSRNEIVQLCDEAKQYGFLGVCVPPYFVKEVKDHLQNANVKVVSVSGFPFGYQSVTTKCEDVLSSIIYGADEIDMVMNVAAFKSGDFDFVRSELELIRRNCSAKILKVIIETGLLTESEIIRACEICADVKVDFVKTSTGFSSGGATVADVRLIRKHLPSAIGIKASGGIKRREFAMELIEAGASRIGTSAGVNLVTT